jgi:hypothetical protein
VRLAGLGKIKIVFYGSDGQDLYRCSVRDLSYMIRGCFFEIARLESLVREWSV